MPGGNRQTQTRNAPLTSNRPVRSRSAAEADEALRRQQRSEVPYPEVSLMLINGGRRAPVVLLRLILRRVPRKLSPQ
jgi:hypothetical protein